MHPRRRHLHSAMLFLEIPTAPSVPLTNAHIVGASAHRETLRHRGSSVRCSRCAMAVGALTTAVATSPSALGCCNHPCSLHGELWFETVQRWTFVCVVLFMVSNLRMRALTKRRDSRTKSMRRTSAQDCDFFGLSLHEWTVLSTRRILRWLRHLHCRHHRRLYWMHSPSTPSTTSVVVI